MSLIAACLLLLWASPAAGAWRSRGLDIGRCVDRRSFHPRAALCASPSFISSAPCRLWRHAGFGRGTQPHQLGCFWAGWTILALALLSPLHFLSEQLLSAHMVEHELIMAVAAPLLVLSRPLGNVALGISHRLAPTRWPSAWRSR